MDENFAYLVQSAKLIMSDKFNDEDLKFIYGLLLSIDEGTLVKYSMRTSLTTVNDLKLYLNLTKFMITYLEENEEYEKCNDLKNKINNLKNIIK